VHSNSDAAESAKAIHARAYTVGSDVAFAGNQFSPATSEGKRLLAHELAHVVQQGGGALLATRRSLNEGEPANGVINGQLRVSSATDTRIQRTPDVKSDYKSGREGWAGLVEATVEELDKRESHYFKYPPKYGDGDNETLLDIFEVALDKDWVKFWALKLQARQGPWAIT